MSRVCVWYTGHSICDTVAKSLARGFDAELHPTSSLTDAVINSYDCHIGYGILRGTADVFKSATRLGKAWFNVDRGYWNANHFNGTYRISYQGTQCRWPDQRIRLAVGKNALTLIAPPTPDVCRFFNIDPIHWLRNAGTSHPNHKLRWKGDAAPIDWSAVEQLVTFNSSLGWQALQRGIPCVSNAQHSVVGSYLDTISIDSKPKVVHSGLKPLFEYMGKHQFTLQQIEKGAAWGLIERYLSS